MISVYANVRNSEMSFAEASEALCLHIWRRTFVQNIIKFYAATDNCMNKQEYMCSF